MNELSAFPIASFRVTHQPRLNAILRAVDDVYCYFCDAAR